jgi:hypothetical protein
MKSEAAAGGLAFHLRVGTQLLRAPRYPPPGALCFHDFCGSYRLLHMATSHVRYHFHYIGLKNIVGNL